MKCVTHSRCQSTETRIIACFPPVHVEKVEERSANQNCMRDLNYYLLGINKCSTRSMLRALANLMQARAERESFRKMVGHWPENLMQPNY